MRKVIDFDPSIATVMNINSISFSEIKSIYFDNDENWPSSYTLTVWDSEYKNTQHFQGELDVNLTRLKMTINPAEMRLPKKELYYEVFSKQYDALIYLGKLVIKK